MKSLNVRKIAALAAGTAMLGAALAGAQANVDAAGVGSYKFYSGAEPNVKIVVGKDGRDALAAGILAAKIANLARSDRDITVVGKDGVGCSVTGGAGGANSTCTLSNQKVSLQITTPGVNPQVAYQMKTYIQGFLDSDIVDDRLNNQIVAPGPGSILNADSTSGGRRVTYVESPALAWRGTITDPVSGKTYTEEERYYLYAQSSYYQTDHQVEAQNGQVAYEAIFTNPIQLCTDFTPGLGACTDQYNTPKHRMTLKFLGQDWVLYDMTAFTADVALPAGAGGSTVSLGKAVQFKEFMQIGDKITAPNGVSVELASISGFGYGAAAQPYASFNIYDASGNKIDSATLQEGGTNEYNKYGVIVRLFKSFPGVNQVNYAQVFVFSDKLTLTNGQVVDTNNQDWNVRLVGGGGAYGFSLAKIQLTRQVISSFLKAGDGVNIITKPAQMRFVFTGTEPVTADPLTFNGVGQLTLASSSTTTTTGSFVRVTSGKSNAFQFPGTSDSANTVYALLGGPGGTSPTAGGTPYAGAWVYQIPGSSNYRTYYGTNSNHTRSIGNTTANTTFNGFGLVGATLANNSQTCQVPNQTITAFTTTANGILNNTGGGVALINFNVDAFGNQGFQMTQTGDLVMRQFSQGFNLSTAVAGKGIATWTNATGTFTPPAGCAEFYLFFNFANGTVQGGNVTITTNPITYLYGTVAQNITMNANNSNGVGVDPDGLDAVFAVEEFNLDTESSTGSGNGAFLIDVGRTGPAETPTFLASNAVPRIGYSTSFNNTAKSTAFGQKLGIANFAGYNTWDSGFVSQRGSVATISTSTISINYATLLSHALYTLSTAAANVTGATATTTFSKGDTALDQAGYKIKVLDVTATGSVAGGIAGAPGACSVTGLDALRTSDSKATVVSDVGAGLVVYDDDPSAASANAVAVGGGLVNARTRAAFGDASLDTNAGATVKVQGNTVGVWGGKQADTRAAAEALVAWLDQNKARLLR